MRLPIHHPHLPEVLKDIRAEASLFLGASLLALAITTGIYLYAALLR